MMYRTVACHGETASPGVGRAVYPTILEVSFICLLGIAVIGKIGRHVRFLPPQKKKRKKRKDVPLLEKQCRYHRCVRRHARAVSA